MDTESFKNALTSFADSPADVDVSKGTFLAQIRDDVIEAKIIQRDAGLEVVENGEPPMLAYKWLTQRVARLPMLADRILEYTSEEQNFIAPNGKLLDMLDLNPEDKEQFVDNVSESILESISQPPAGTTSALYLTSDAGEGKTTLINHVAREQARLYKEKQAARLVVPIRLGGRPFMRLDDVIIAELSNKLRFQLLYYNSFIELVRMGAIVPALDGFEEMFVESAAGDAHSALGNLMNELSSSGQVIIAARKAYFEFQSFSAQARLFDSISTDCDVSFSRLAINRWDRAKFLAYTEIRNFPNGEEIYDLVVSRFNSEHPVLTRAVLVKRLIDVAESGSINELVDRLGQAPEDYFFEFVDAIIEREAREKWIDRGGESAEPLLSVEQHHLLLESIAKEMSLNSADALRRDYIEVVAEMFASENELSPQITQQVKERIQQHSLLTVVENSTRMLAFDHEDFKKFFLGRAIASTLMGADAAECLALFKSHQFSQETASAAVHRLVQSVPNSKSVIETLEVLRRRSSVTSYVRSNVGSIVIRLLEAFDDADGATKIDFPAESLNARILTGLTFKNCRFAPTSLQDSNFEGSSFFDCHFELLELPVNRMNQFVFERCVVESTYRRDRDERCFDPMGIVGNLRESGIKVIGTNENVAMEDVKFDSRTELACRALRAFTRATHITENSFRRRLGPKATEFFEDVLPTLLECGAVEETEFKGSKRSKKFKLGVQMKNVERVIRKSYSEYEVFLRELTGK